ncbi:MAG: ScpA family protein [Candidatus Magasanikbacteria bacterium]|nr:ScpA family protein [Candidatus Magasanikbacteria bacterium]
MPHQLKLEQFEGPLSLLLKLVEQERLTITEVSLSKVTESFIDYLRGNKNIPDEEMADFLVIATKLLYIKSKALLPEQIVEPEEGISLEDQLRMYKEFVEAAKKIEGVIKRKKFAYLRENLVKIQEEGFYPPKGLTTEKMEKMFQDILERLRPIVELPQVALEKAVTIREKIEHIHNLLADFKKIEFKHLLGFARNRTEIIVSFLAVLELTKQQHVVISQANNFEEIYIEKL